MKRFVLRLSLFAVLVTGIIGGLCAWEIAAEVRKYHEEIVAPAAASVLLCGDSQLGNAVDPSICSEFFNFSAHGRALDQGYMIMMDILKANPGRFRKVLVDVSPAAAIWPLDSPLHEMSFSASYWLIHFLHLHENTRDLSYGFRVVRDYLIGKRLRHAWRAVRGRVEFHSSLYGHFTPIPDVNRRDNPRLYEGQIKQKAQLTKGVADISADAPMFKVLERTAAAAAAANVEMVLITTPWNRELIGLCGEAELDRFTEKLGRWSADRGLRYVNLLKTELSDECWLDANHLNASGAKVFTLLLKGRLKDIGAL